MNTHTLPPDTSEQTMIYDRLAHRLCAAGIHSCSMLMLTDIDKRIFGPEMGWVEKRFPENHATQDNKTKVSRKPSAS